MWVDRSRGVDLNPRDAYVGLLSFNLNLVYFTDNVAQNADYASKSQSDFLLIKTIFLLLNIWDRQHNHLFPLPLYRQLALHIHPLQNFPLL